MVTRSRYLRHRSNTQLENYWMSVLGVRTCRYNNLLMTETVEISTNKKSTEKTQAEIRSEEEVQINSKSEKNNRSAVLITTDKQGKKTHKSRHMNRTENCKCSRGTSNISLLKSRKYMVFVSTETTLLRVGLVICLFNTAMGPNLIITDVLNLNRRETLCHRNMLEVQSAHDTN